MPVNKNWMDGCVDGCVDGHLDELMVRCVNGKFKRRVER